jgi:hypothetical protein
MKPACLNRARREKAKRFNTSDTRGNQNDRRDAEDAEIPFGLRSVVIFGLRDWRVGTGLRFWRVCAHYPRCQITVAPDQVFLGFSYRLVVVLTPAIDDDLERSRSRPAQSTAFK